MAAKSAKKAAGKAKAPAAKAPAPPPSQPAKINQTNNRKSNTPSKVKAATASPPAPTARRKRLPLRPGKGDKVLFTFHTVSGPLKRSGKLAEEMPDKGRVKVLCEGAVFRPWALHVAAA